MFLAALLKVAKTKKNPVWWLVNILQNIHTT
jgi:hypothetical protein